ncbi:MAG: glycosyltransferase family 2 protein [Candidatus Diapherotrites archaeon]|nr:glycosyltransferase family 2 protein [Candidatus Diapherotrites archaeon]
MDPPTVSIIIATYNNAPVLRKTIEGILRVDYPNLLEVLVINDGSSDGTREMLDREFSGRKKIRIIHRPRSGVTRARNRGIREARGEIVVNMDHDCIPHPDWLKNLVNGFDSPRVGMVSSFALYGGTSTAFRREALEKTGGYDEDYFYFREDSDLAFKIMEAGFELRKVEAEYEHDHEPEKPNGITGLLAYAWKRAQYRQNDVLLYQKHPNNPEVKKFLSIRGGFIVDPRTDMNLSTGRWWTEEARFELSSPRGITFIQNRSPVHAALILLAAFAYMLLLKLTRLYASIKFGKLLI